MGWYNAEKRELNEEEEKRQKEIYEELKKLDKETDIERRKALKKELFFLEYGNEMN